ncbi:TetR/AcrR family transcriptional regulator [Aquibacillus koreensis]|uniref:TetR/AcrR family transcriptional regulator n=1 Tax=Aquibacillus koreensis TaxID=279446 RepID=A0A9X4AIK2_9BACI|nr:TetR/AcrR family transcriptional regulator [Aquibacillus koreensis]MCT2536519.1 TetR/AcrR family transcriptional regulator [Aquibacillus koreensis]MDC3419393.1 TetR/AcrR family transcriptional regulator [Aquibacillus koreensis]
MSKKLELKETAQRIFSENGYHLTSIQQLAKETGMSKGAFYNHFDSKEQLFTELIKDHHAAIFTYHNDSSDHTSHKQLLQKQIETELGLAHKNRSFLLTVFKEFPSKKGNDMTELMEKFRTDLLRMHKQLLEAAYGDAIDLLACDLTVILEGMMKEYMGLIIFYDLKISTVDVSKFIISSLDALVAARQHLQPILKESSLFNTEKLHEPLDHEVLEKLFSELVIAVNSLNIPDDQIKKYQDAVRKLQELEKTDEADPYLVEALLHYLKQEQELRSIIDQLEKMIF